MKTIDVTQLGELAISGPIDLMDVRTPIEFQEVHATYAKNDPLDSLDPVRVMTNRTAAADQPLYLICRSGGRSSKAVQKFIAAGYDNVVNVEGGTMAWAAAGLPVVRGKKSLSLMRQVQITAGFLVLLGAILGYFVNPSFIGISAFVGAGLMLAGITGSCTMATLLAKMPWNQCGDASSCSV